MAVVHDYKCDLHGFFESREAVCPEGCTENVKKVFLRPPAYKSDKTKRTDKTVRGLAQDFDMSNIKSTREGENQAGFYTRKNKTSKKQLDAERAEADHRQRQEEQRPGRAAIWGGGFKGITMGSALSGQVTRPVAGESVGFNPKDAGNLTGPKASSYVADHENLQVKTK
jgi:hypothetical protein